MVPVVVAAVATVVAAVNSSVAEFANRGMQRPGGERTSYFGQWREFLVFNSAARRFGLNRRPKVNLLSYRGLSGIFSLAEF